MRWRLTHHDLVYLVETLMPTAVDLEDAAARLRSDELLLSAMLDDEHLFDRLLGDEDVLVRDREVYGVRTDQGEVRAGAVVQCLREL
mgnify:CR=1 FL=1